MTQYKIERRCLGKWALIYKGETIRFYASRKGALKAVLNLK